MPDLTPDCAACAALCCVALALDKGPRFGLDKPAGLPCPNLAHHRCTIHERLDEQGFSGCTAYDCRGAGQRTIALFEGQSWRDNPTLLPAQSETFGHVRRLHDLLELLTLADRLPLTPSEQATRTALVAEITAPLTPARAATLASGPLPKRVRLFLQALRPHAMQAG